MFLRSRAAPELLRRVNLRGGAISVLEHRKNSRWMALECKCVAGFRVEPLMKASPGPGICLEQIRWKGNSEMPPLSPGVQEHSAQEASPGSCGPFPGVQGSSWKVEEF